MNGRGGGGQEGIGQAVAGVWAAATAQDLARALAECNSYHPIAAARFFRGAIRLRFPMPCDPRQVSQALSDWLARFPQMNQEMLVPREAEAFIRAELNGEADLVADVAIDSNPVRTTLMVVTRCVFEEALASAPSFADLRRITAQAAQDHRDLAAITSLKLDSIFVRRDLNAAEFEALIGEADTVRWT